MKHDGSTTEASAPEEAEQVQAPEAEADAAAEAPVEEPASEFENWALVELETEDGLKLTRFRTAKIASARSPEGSRIWGRAKLWAENSHFEDYIPTLLPDHADLCEVDDVRRHQVDWKAKRVWPVLLSIAEDGSEEGDAEMAKDTERRGAGKTKGAAKTAKAAKAGGRGVKAKETNGSGRGRKSSINQDAKLKIGWDKNPGRPGTNDFAQRELMKNGLKVSTFLANGGKLLNLRYEIKRGNVSLVD